MGGRSGRGLSPAERLVREGQAIGLPLGPGGRPVRKPGTNADRLRRAIAKYSEAIALDPRLADAYVLRASARSLSGDRRGARADASTAYALRPRDPADYLLISLPFPEKERRRILRTGIARARPGSFDYVHLGLSIGNTYWYEGRFDLEHRHALRSIRELETSGKTGLATGFHYEAGTALMAMGRYASAERHLRAAFRDHATTGMLARTSVVDCRIYRGDLEGALQVLDEVAPRLTRDLVTLTRAYVRALGPAPLRISRALEARLLVPDRPHHDGYMGAVILNRLGHADVARPRLRRFIERCEGNPREWGVTRRWEIAKAKALLAGRSGRGRRRGRGRGGRRGGGVRSRPR